MGLRWKLLWPPLLCALGGLVVLAAEGEIGAKGLARVALGELALLAIAALVVQRWLLGPLSQLRAECAERPVGAGGGGEVVRLEQDIRRLNARLAQLQEELEQTREDCRQGRAALQRSEERFAIAVRSAHDGLWEWDLQSGAVQFSPRWKAMLGYAEDEFPGRREAWLEHMHPDDAAEAERDSRACIAGESTQFERQLRLRHRDGRYRWMLSRGAVLRHASGKPYRMVGLDTDINRVKRVESIVEEIAEGTAGAQGEVFFRALVRHFAGALQVTCAFVTECVDQPTTRVRTLAYWKAQDFRDNIEFDLAGTPCETVVRDGVTSFLPTGVGRAFPRDAAYESYIGVPIFGVEGGVIGHLAFFDTRPMSDEALVEPIFRIFTARAGAELERRNALDRLARYFSQAA